MTNTGPSRITDDLGVSPGTAVVGFPPGLVFGTTHAADAVAELAKADLVTAYNDAASRATTETVTADLGGQTLVPGVYTGPTLSLTGALSLDAQGDPDAVFVFQSSSTLITASSSRITVINGGSACNVYFQVGSSATLGTNSSFIGTVLATTSITANTGATVQGRLLARNAAVTLDDNTIDRPVCDLPTPPTTTSTATTSSTAPTTAPPTTAPPTTAPPTTAPPTTASVPPTSPTTTGGGGGATPPPTTSTGGATTPGAGASGPGAPGDALPTPGSGAPDTGGADGNGLNWLIALALVLVAGGLGLGLRPAPDRASRTNRTSRPDGTASAGRP